MNLIIFDKTQNLDSNIQLRDNYPKYIIIHSTVKYSSFENLLNYHKNILSWEGVGYHYFIDKYNHTHLARPENIEGAHALGFNTNSIGICIYSEDLKQNPPKKRIKNLKKIIEDLQLRYDNKLILIPHTYAILEYNNKLLAQNGIEQKFENDIDVSKPEKFAKILTESEKITTRLSNEKYFDLKQSLKNIKNCPGELFYELLE